MPGYRGLTWDHPRGRTALRAAAGEVAQPDLEIEWDVHPLEGFESAPIAELASRYDLIVLDHPHLGEALDTSALQPVDALLDEEELRRLEADTVGPSLTSYRMAGRLWALPLDAAGQVAVRRPDAVPDAPATWGEVIELSRSRRVALSLAGPHAFLTFCSIAVAFGEEPNTGDAGPFVSDGTGARVFELMTELTGRAPAGTETLNPIAMLEALAGSREGSGDGGIDYCPLIFGYVNYAAPASGRPLVFSDAPVLTAGGRPGSTIGGTGIAISARCTPGPELVAHLRWLLSRETQAGFIPAHEGQPSARSAWLDPRVNQASGNFYTATLATIEQSWVRPRYSGYIGFQSQASALLRRALTERSAAPAVIAELNRRYADSLPHVSSADERPRR